MAKVEISTRRLLLHTLERTTHIMWYCIAFEATGSKFSIGISKNEAYCIEKLSAILVLTQILDEIVFGRISFLFSVYTLRLIVHIERNKYSLLS